MTEDEELLAKIGQLAGQINQHKNQSHPAMHSGYSGSQYTRHSRGGWRPYRGRGRGALRASAGPHRNRTLVLNNQSAPVDAASTAASSSTPSNEAPDSKPDIKNSWIAKRDRHMQLINSSIFDQETQARNKAIAETRRLKAQKKAAREESMVLRHAQSASRFSESNRSEAQPDGRAYTIFVGDIPFQVAQGGSKLISLSSEDILMITIRGSRISLWFIDDPLKANVTPKRVKVGGVTFVRSKRGNLHRLGAVVSKKKPGKVKKRNELCKRFTSTGTCFKGPTCPYVHDPNKVAICKDFLQTGKCDAGVACDLSHDPSPERSPACLHFLRGRCTNSSCRYTHVHITPGASVCRDFAILGYCSKGASCEGRHVHECPDYANTGNCGNKKCPLPHVDRAGQIRKFTANKVDPPAEGDSEEDVSSDDEVFEEIDSDDVDSDDLEEPEVIVQGTDGGDASQQLDFIGFS
ncbi:Zinc finger, CCCH-type [Trichophyton interdigitale]|uniref:Zinc finger, CCCH-type n=1 Tax=Trichophyton interdigitale TaxID=101480 RepID=A0A9P5D0C9_9EURO|nr:Zinc finger, CCCH-type [Trichophyton interdigitale]KAF3900839.1 Zinc finger, CCCH-type [Trichophyton interdigitale]KAG8211831.1 Zinc finger, CCCH-type [Trichophyton interdigitale]